MYGRNNKTKEEKYKERMKLKVKKERFSMASVCTTRQSFLYRVSRFSIRRFFLLPATTGFEALPSSLYAPDSPLFGGATETKRTYNRCLSNLFSPFSLTFVSFLRSTSLRHQQPDFALFPGHSDGHNFKSTSSS